MVFLLKDNSNRYVVTHCWPEPDFIPNAEPVNGMRPYCKRWKFRCQFLEKNEPAWFLKGDEIESERKPIDSRMCDACGKDSPWVYDEWMCLVADCIRYWKITTRNGLGGVDEWIEAPEMQMRSEFLAPALLPPAVEMYGVEMFNHTDQSVVNRNHSREPPHPLQREPLPDDVERLTPRALFCTKCGRMGCRENWSEWRCPNCEVFSFAYIAFDQFNRRFSPSGNKNI